MLIIWKSTKCIAGRKKRLRGRHANRGPRVWGPWPRLSELSVTILSGITRYRKTGCNQGRNEGARGGAIPRAPSQYGGPKSLRSTEWLRGGKKVPTMSQRPQFQTWGRQTCFLPRAPSNRVTSLGVMRRYGKQKQYCRLVVFLLLELCFEFRCDLLRVPQKHFVFVKNFLSWCNFSANLA